MGAWGDKGGLRGRERERVREGIRGGTDSSESL